MALFLHLLGRRLGQKEATSQIHPHHLKKRFGRIAEEIPEKGNPGIGNHNIQSAKLRYRLPYHPCYYLHITGIPMKSNTTSDSTGTFYFLNGFPCQPDIQIVQYDFCPPGYQLSADFQAYALPCSGNDRYFVLKIHSLSTNLLMGIPGYITARFSP